MRRALLAMVCLACSTPPASPDASTDASLESAPDDAGECDADLVFEYQFPDAAPRRVCLPLDAPGIAVHYAADDAGSCDGGVVIDTSVTATSSDASVAVALIEQARDLFGTYGPFGVRLQLKDSNVLFDTNFPSCPFLVTSPGTNGQAVAGGLANPCTLPPVPIDAAPAEVTMLIFEIHGTVKDVCP